MNSSFTFPELSAAHRRCSTLRRDRDRLTRAAHIVIALAAFLAGLMLGQLGGDAPRGSRIPWPAPARADGEPRSQPR